MKSLKQNLNTKTFKENSQEELKAGFESVFTQIHTIETEIWAQGKTIYDSGGFLLQADGVNYGPFLGIKVSPIYCDKDQKKKMGLTFRTFLPIIQ